jgi:hypothetical protein
MTDRINAVVVVLDKDIRIDDAETGIISAIRHLRGVIDVRPVTANIETAIAESRVRSEMTEKIWRVLHPKKDET